jgi:holo-[acyl-carrier protein] synthase
MIIGVGIDIVEVDRIRSALERFGGRFQNRIFRDEEIAYCRSHRHAETHFAARFAAKEAVSKALGTGIGQALGWLDMEVCRKTSGEPFLMLHGGAHALLESRAGKNIFLSLSHTQSHAVAVAVIEG